jgi:hypothetical protein
VPEGFDKQIIAELKRAGFQRAKGGKGSHEKWIARGTPRCAERQLRSPDLDGSDARRHNALW